MRAASKAIYDLCIIAMAVAVMTLCSWITIPFYISLTLQTFAVFLIAGCFPTRISASAMILYITLGMLGVPVFSGFNAGVSAVMGPTGGFILSFPLCAIIISIFGRGGAKASSRYVCACALSLLLSYTMGALWYALVFSHSPQTTIWSVITVCILPFVIPDILKLFLSTLVMNRLRSYIQRLPI